ncbi:MAG: hypothetical protein AB7G15_19940, partial [Alphaproteobacteria bacterium]
PQDAHRHWAGALSVQDGLMLAKGMAWTGLHGERAVGCGGLMPIAPHRALAWALIGAPPKPAWPRIHRQVRRAIAHGHAQGYARIEMHVDAEFPAARRWARLLGFAEEARLRQALANRHDCLMMVKFDEIAEADL